MAKETYYFSHDYNARSDKEMMKVRMKMGMCGVGLYWCIVEMLYEEGGYLSRNEYERIAFELQSKFEDVTMLIEQFKLFKFDDEKFWSDSALERLNKRKSKSEKARESVSHRWKHTNVLRTENDGYTIKERKGEESKEKENKPDGLERIDDIPVESEIFKKNNMPPKNGHEEIPLPFTDPDFLEKWKEWLKYRKERRLAAYAPTGLKSLFTRLKKMCQGDPKIAIEVIDQSLANNWQGLFELKQNFNGKSNQRESSTIGKTIEFDRP